MNLEDELTAVNDDTEKTKAYKYYLVALDTRCAL